MQLSCNNTLKTLINETMSAHLVNLLQFFLNFFSLIINYLQNTMLLFLQQCLNFRNKYISLAVSN